MEKKMTSVTKQIRKISIEELTPDMQELASKHDMKLGQAWGDASKILRGESSIVNLEERISKGDVLSELLKIKGECKVPRDKIAVMQEICKILGLYSNGEYKQIQANIQTNIIIEDKRSEVKDARVIN